MSGLVDLLAARSSRERVLLAVLMLVGLPALVFVSVLEPARRAHESAIQTRDEALALNSWVAARAGEMPAVVESGSTASTPVGSTGIEEALISASLRSAVSDLSEADGGVIELRFDSVTFTQLAAWMTSQSPVWGYDLSGFRIEATDVSGKVSASLTLTPP